MKWRISTLSSRPSTFLPIAFGTSDIKRVKYLFFNLLGALVWGIFFALGGYVLGDAIERSLVHVQRAEKFIILGVIAIVILVQGVLFLRRRIAARVEEEIEEEEDRAEHKVDTVNY